MANILSRQRYTAAFTGNTATIAAGSSNQSVGSVSNCVTNLPQNSIVRISVLDSIIAVDAGGIAKVTIQSALLNVDSGALHQPAYSGSPLGLANGATLQGEIRFHSEDLSDATFAVALNVTGANSDTSSHTIQVSGTLLVEIVTFNEPVYAENIAGL